MAQRQLPPQHPMAMIRAPDECQIWLLKRFEAHSPTKWSNSCAGAVSFFQEVYEVFLTEGTALPASTSVKLQDFAYAPKTMKNKENRSAKGLGVGGWLVVSAVIGLLTVIAIPNFVKARTIE